MNYQGSKLKQSKLILPIILADRHPEQPYVEPFVGGFNMIDKVEGYRVANDKHPYLIALFKSILDGWIPPEYTSENQYDLIKNNKEAYEPCLVGFVGFCCSYGGKWFGGYARGKNAAGEHRNHGAEGKRRLLKQKSSLSGVKIFNKDYLDLKVPDHSIVYCDPPYRGTTPYGWAQLSVEYSVFWDWCRQKSKDGCTIFVSENEAPEDFACVWEKEVPNTMALGTIGQVRYDRLFTLKKRTFTIKVKR
jgi:DNA adenine methylase